MIAVVVLLAVVAVAAVVAAIVAFARAGRAEAEVAAGSKRVGDLVEKVGDLETRLAERGVELASVSESLRVAERDATSAGEDREAVRKEADEHRTRADTAEGEAARLTSRVERLEAEIMTVTEAKVGADARADALAVTARTGSDERDGNGDAARGLLPVSHEALWRLELARSERLWRTSVAVVPDETSPIATADDPLRVALDIELAAAREESGVEIDLEIDLPRPLDPPEALAVLRSTQELLPVAVRAGHATTLWVAAAGDDVIVEVSSLDDEGTPLEVAVPALPPGRLVAQNGGIRLVGALADGGETS